MRCTHMNAIRETWEAAARKAEAAAADPGWTLDALAAHFRGMAEPWDDTPAHRPAVESYREIDPPALWLGADGGRDGA